MAGEAAELIAAFDVDLPSDRLPGPSWNVAPTDPVPIVLDSLPKPDSRPGRTAAGSGEDADPATATDPGRLVEPVRRLEPARWGLVPSWAKSVSAGARAFNARIETVTETASFKTAVRKRRALIPATGYYEWHTADGVKRPYFIHLPDELTVFAGLYEWWRDPARAADDPDRWVLSATILTRDSVGELGSIHDRMPVFLEPGLIDDWLDPHTDADDAVDGLLAAVTDAAEEVADRMERYEVGSAVGNVRNNGPELMEPAQS